MVDRHAGVPSTPVLPRTGPWSSRASDETLLERVSLGDRPAFAALYDSLAPAVFGVARGVVVDPSLAEEVTQDVFLSVWAKPHAFDRTRGSARSWILTLARRRAIDVVRHEQASRNRSARSAAASTQRPFDEVADLVVERLPQEERAKDLVKALACLSEVQLAAVELAYFKGLTYREVAEVLGVPLGTAKTRIRDGLRRLAQQLGPDDRELVGARSA